MTKSWLKVFLPTDEYKERQMLYFLAEAAVLAIVIMIGMIAIDALVTPITGKVVLLVMIAFIILYTGARYIFAGIEYTDVDTEELYKHQRKLLVTKSVIFYSIFISTYVIFNFFNLFNMKEDLLELVAVGLLASVFLFGTSYISLKKSYEKNKDIM